MDTDLLFLVIKQEDWRKISAEGKFKPEFFSHEKPYIRTFTGTEAEKFINHHFSDENQLLLIVLDPLRIQFPVKHINEDGFSIIAVYGEISIDAIIDRIKLQKSEKGKFSVKVKHFD